MTATITATAAPTHVPPRVALSVSGMSSGSTVRINRVDAAGNQAFVRTANPGTLVSGAWAGFDYEAPFGESFTYMAIPDVGSPATSTSVTLNVTQPWLLHASVPDWSVPILVTAVPERTFSTNQGVFNPLGRSTAVVITDGVRRAATYDLTLRTETAADATALVTILSDASPLLLQAPAGLIYEWVAVGDVVRTPMVPVWSSPYITWTLPCTVTDAPSGLLVSQFQWADVVANYSTWQDVINAYPTWQDVVLNTPS